MRKYGCPMLIRIIEPALRAALGVNPSQHPKPLKSTYTELNVRMATLAESFN